MSNALGTVEICADGEVYFFGRYDDEIKQLDPHDMGHGRYRRYAEQIWTWIRGEAPDA